MNLNSPFSNVVKLQAELLRKGRCHHQDDQSRLTYWFVDTKTLRGWPFPSTLFACKNVNYYLSHFAGDKEPVKTTESRENALGFVPQEASIPGLVSDRAEEQTSDPREETSNLLSYEEMESHGSKHLKRYVSALCFAFRYLPLFLAVSHHPSMRNCR